MSRVIGVDPGKTGGYALVQNGELMWAVPFKKDMSVCRGLISIARFFYVDAVYIERVTASPQMGVVSAFTFGKWAEAVETAAILSGVKTTCIRPQVWQSALGCLSKGDKNKLYTLAKSIFPEQYKKNKFNKSTADAVLIAYYGWKCISTQQDQEDDSDS